ncbi:hypothetical protein WUBG_19144 [Wuchereria bancrofti]|uniref:Uncharacterized protein n=1 Tax=Wuchereria bancrofti TaxID=6293 RepID=J9DKF0_WUCBA|nr:hypothetical protein WUBG_19144 [Wuchereria bancrofti]
MVFRRIFSLDEKVRHTMERGASTAPPTTYQLQIDPNITFNSVNRPFEELPENFLESISPQQNQSSAPQESPQLAPLAPMSLGSNDK